MRYKKYIMIKCFEIYKNSTDEYYKIIKFYTAWFEAYTGLCLLGIKKYNFKDINLRERLLKQFTFNKIPKSKLLMQMSNDQQEIDLFMEQMKPYPIQTIQQQINKDYIKGAFADEDRRL